jgi:hypothetical protein
MFNNCTVKYQNVFTPTQFNQDRKDALQSAVHAFEKKTTAADPNSRTMKPVFFYSLDINNAQKMDKKV